MEEEVNGIEWKFIRKKFMSWWCNPEKFTLNEVVLGILKPGSGVFQSVTCIVIASLLEHMDEQ